MNTLAQQDPSVFNAVASELERQCYARFASDGDNDMSVTPQYLVREARRKGDAEPTVATAASAPDLQLVQGWRGVQ